MRNVTFISAGAGSGKTYTLTKRIVEFIKGGICSADEIILTTFTRAAAGELREKVRSALYKEGLYEAAERIDNAAVGTIHSIAYQIVSRYWYLLKISADVRMIAEEDQEFYVAQSLASLPEEKDLEMFRRMRQAFEVDEDFWKTDLRAMIDRINNFCIDAAGLEKSREDSKAFIRTVLAPGERTRPDSETVLAKACRVRDACSDLKRGKPEEKKQKIVRGINEFERGMQKTSLNVGAYFKLASAVTDEMTKELQGLCPDEFDFFSALPGKVLADPAVYDLQAEYIDTIFSLADKWRQSYRQFKNDRRLLDFNDVQAYFAELLEHPEVVGEIRSRYKVALVDEFQDCSPQQVRFFQHLSDLMVQSVWVGDLKQAIYNFRGTDTELVRKVLDEIDRKEKGNRLEQLEFCWRSNKTVIDLANSVFSRVFRNTLPESLITLRLPERPSDDCPEERAALHWHFEVDRADDRFGALAEQMKRLHAEQKIAYKDMAVLCRWNAGVVDYAAALRAAGIPCRVTCDGAAGANDMIFDFLTALVSVAAYGQNSFSQAQVAYYTEPGYTVAKIVSDRLRYLARKGERQGEWLEELDLFRRISSLGKVIGNQSVASAVETLLVELNAADLIRRLNPSADAYDYCEIFMAAARSYEEQCANLGLGCSLPGLVSYVAGRVLSQSGDEDGVTVSTYHKSKGLEWKCVVLCSLDHGETKPQHVISGVQVLRGQDGASILLFPNALFGLCETVEAVLERIRSHTFYQDLADTAFEEAKRLMYVGMTRPKELLVTTSAQALKKKKMYGMDWLEWITGDAMRPENCTEDSLLLLGNALRFFRIRYGATEETGAENPDAAAGFEVLRTPVERPSYLRRDVQPSKAAPSADPTGIEVAARFAERLRVSAADHDDARIGDCIHHLLCIYRDDAAFAAGIPRIAQEYGVSVDAGAFMDSARRLYACLAETYGVPLAVEREVPFRFQEKNGQVISGEIDLIYRTEAGDVLVDYKSHQGAADHLTDPENAFFAGKYGGQIALYETAMRRAGRHVRDRLICYFSLGMLIRLPAGR